MEPGASGGTGPIADVAAIAVENLALARPATATLADRIRLQIRPEELKRRLVHGLPGVFPYVFYFCPQSDPLETWSLWVVTATCAAGAIICLALRPAFRRDGERSWATSVLSFTGIVPVLLWLFPGKSEIACAVVSIIAFGDSSATFAGLLFGERPLPWNPAKSWIGSAAFVAGALPFSVFAFWLQTRPAISPAAAFTCVAPAVVLSAIAESLPVKINDNIRVGIVAAVAIIVLHSVTIGS